MLLKPTIIKLHRIISQFGLDPLRFARSMRGLPGFIHDWRLFRQGYAGRLTLVPCLHDWFEEGGTTRSEYFWQDLLVARSIHEAKPERHVDVGSRVDGFVAHVASFREIEVFDVRPIPSLVPGVVFRQADLMDARSMPSDVAGGYCDSLSCLHALEHFGLGRYGDPINPRGYEQGIANMVKLLKPGGTLYLSTPIGRERVEFNANWVFDPRTILNLAESNQMKLQRLVTFNPVSGLREIQPNDADLVDLATSHYHLGIFIFIKSPC
ncbi:MAG: DUF268 domain-containing protein [Chromatiaceae bacterium]|nr:DUF268 domain-containing protein [Chromatiaceae bacterium]